MRFWLKIFGAFIFFILGIVVAQIWAGFSEDVRFSLSGGGILFSPPDKIEARNVLVYDDRVVIPIVGARVVNYASSGSMVPVLDSKSNGIVVTPNSVDEIGIGDIVSFHSDGELIAHRVIEIESDLDGDYFLVKGDNAPDVELIRFENIEGVLVGVIY